MLGIIIGVASVIAMLAIGQGLRDRHRHLLLLWPELEILRPRKNALRGKDLSDLFNEVLG